MVDEDEDDNDNEMSFIKFLDFARSTRMHLKKRDAFAQGLIDRVRNVAKENEIRKNTMILVSLQLQETDPEYYTDELIRNYVLNMLSADLDTSTMEWALSLSRGRLRNSFLLLLF